MSAPPQTLFDLMPALYRLRDAKLAQSQNLAMGPLQSLLMLIDEQFQIMADDLNQRYDDQFIETCAPWVIPYIGDLIGYQSIQGITASVDNPRSEVAETISLRRRKGTVLVLEQLARDVTGWGAHAMEFFRVLGDTQYMKHIRRENFYTPDLRRWEPRFYVNTGFDKTSHKVDVRNVTDGRGPCNIQNIGIFLWSLGAYSITQGTPTPAPDSAGGALCYRFSSLGMDMPLFHLAVSRGEQIAVAATPANVPERLRRLLLCSDMQKGAGSQYYGEGASLALYLNGQLLNPYQIQVANLSGSDGSWANVPARSNPYAALVDPDLGRIALPPAVPSPTLTVSYDYGYNADMGGGEYAREDGFTVTNEASILPYPDIVTVTGSVTGGVPFDAGEEVVQTTTGASSILIGTVSGSNPMIIEPITGTADATDTWIGQTSGAVYTPNAAPTPIRYHTLQDALNYAGTQLPLQGRVALEITSSASLVLPLAAPLTIDLPAGTTLEFRAADGARPTLLLGAEMVVTGDAESTLLVNGLVIAASAGMAPGSPSPAALVHVPASRPDGSPNLLQELDLFHCTLVPGWAVTSAGEPVNVAAPALIAEPANVEIVSDFSILGAIRATALVTVNLSDSIVDATDPTQVAYAALDGQSGGGALTLQGCTVVGKMHAEALTLVSNSIVCAQTPLPPLSPTDPWVSALVADRKQVGCVRFSFLPVNAVIPRSFECVEQALASAQPIFFSLRYGRPAYMKMLACTDNRIRRGADGGGEMGAFHFVLAPLRESDLKVRLQEYLPVGLNAGLVYQS